MKKNIIIINNWMKLKKIQNQIIKMIKMIKITEIIK